MSTFVPRASLKMAAKESDQGVAALVYDYLKKNVGDLAETFKAKVQPPVLSQGSPSLTEVFTHFQSSVPVKRRISLTPTQASKKAKPSKSSSEDSDDSSDDSAGVKSKAKIVNGAAKKMNGTAPPVKAQPGKKPVAKKESSSDDSSDDSEDDKTAKKPVTPAAKTNGVAPKAAAAQPAKKAAAKKESSDDSDSDSEEEAKPVAKRVATPAAKPVQPKQIAKSAVAKKESSSEESSSEDEAPKSKVTPAKPAPAKVTPAAQKKKKESSSEDSSDDSEEEAKPKKAATPAKAVTPAAKPAVAAKKKAESSDDSSDDSEDEKPKKVASPVKAPAAAPKKAAAKKESSSEEDSSEDEAPAKPAAKPAAAPKAKAAAAKKESSSEEESSEEEDDAKPKKAAATKPAAKKESSEEEESEDEPIIKKAKTEDESSPGFFNNNKWNGNSQDSQSVKADLSQNRKSKSPFRRVVAEEVEVDYRLADNSFDAKKGARGSWGERANQDLKHTKGKSFRHEKTKKKRGAYRGGLIKIASKKPISIESAPSIIAFVIIFKMAQFNKKITNARNSNANLAVEVEEQQRAGRAGRRVSANQIETRTLRGEAHRKNFTTITPQGLPADLIGDDEEPVQRQQLLVGAKILKNEGARLPPFKPFKTISDEDNIHLLPGETGERARLNLLDTKMVTKKDVQEVKEAYARMRKQYPHLYRKQKEDPHADEKDKKPEEPPKPEEKKPEPPEEKHEHEHEHEHKHEQEHHQHKSSDTPKPPEPLHRPSEPHPQQPRRSSGRSRRNIRVSSSSSSYESSSYESSSSEEESFDGGPDQSKAMKKWYKQYYASQGQAFQGPGQYPGFPGGYSPYNNPYPMGFGPMQGPPCYNPCCEEVQVGKRQPKISVTKRTTERQRLKKPQGLNFDFLPHDDLATEVTMTIEPDDPEPLQYAVENGIMPIICCYMPTSLAVNQQQPSNNPSFAGYPQSSNTYGYGSNSKGSSGSGSGSQSGSSVPKLGSGGVNREAFSEASTVSSSK
ncbi:Nucleolar and coiled-body phosphoprotein 1 [Orchesella cincta]|uniref:Nucleolar and coiled-body phosphoprotein 1 n=1 Tax=Orchesella cincta TaxID=48709 RepID=A0A1D2NN10_ORCCI|nr:Nucleolar and coiled-body phosphoprotein 1 [Orchesella cincta]